MSISAALALFRPTPIQYRLMVHIMPNQFEPDVPITIRRQALTFVLDMHDEPPEKVGDIIWLPDGDELSFLRVHSIVARYHEDSNQTLEVNACPADSSIRLTWPFIADLVYERKWPWLADDGLIVTSDDRDFLDVYPQPNKKRL